MKRILCMLLLAMSFAGTMLAQDDNIDELPFEDEPLREEKQAPYFAIAGGYTGTFLKTDLDGVNALFEGAGLQPISGSLFLSGGQGFTGIPWVENLRLGVLGMGGVGSTEVAELNAGAVPIKRQGHYNVSLFGFSVDYGIVLFKDFAILPGVSLGWGDLDLDIEQAPAAEQTWGMADGGITNYHKNLMFVQPNLNIEYAVTAFAALKVNVGYNLAFDPLIGDKEWMLNNQTTVAGVPDDINGSGLTFGFGLFLGLFNY